MIDLKYHVVSLIGVFLALGLGILIGSTIVSDDIMVGQQRKIIDRLEVQFSTLRERESTMLAQNESKDKMIGDYENFSQAMVPLVVKAQIPNSRVAIIVTGGQDIPAGLPNALDMAGAQLVSQTVALSNINMKDVTLRKKLTQFYNLDEAATSDVLRQKVAISLALIVSNKADLTVKSFLEENGLLKFRGDYFTPVDQVILVGGADNLSSSFVESFDEKLIEVLIEQGKKVVGVETSTVHYSYMGAYQSFNISTIDNIDLSPGQISLVLSMGGEPGDYGIKATAGKFMPSLPVDDLRRQ